MDKIKPHFHEGGKLSKLESVYDGMETSKSGVHIYDSNDMKPPMITVVVALLPCLLFAMYNIGYQHFKAIGVDASFWEMFLFGLLAMLPVIVVSYVVGLGIEFIGAQIHHKEIQEGFLVTGILIPLIVPINTPLWMTAVATAFAVIFAKEIFGGTGMNIFNVALITRAFLFFAYPSKMSGDNAFVKIDSAFGLWWWQRGGRFLGSHSSWRSGNQCGDNFQHFYNGCFHRPHSRFSWRDLNDSNLDWCRNFAFHRHCLMESDVECLCRRPGNGSNSSCFSHCNLSSINARPISTAMLWRICLCSCVHGYRSCNRCTHQDWTVHLWIFNRCICHSHPCVQRWISRGGNARSAADERLCAAHRLLRGSSQY